MAIRYFMRNAPLRTIRFQESLKVFPHTSPSVQFVRAISTTIPRRASEQAQSTDAITTPNLIDAGTVADSAENVAQVLGHYPPDYMIRLLELMHTSLGLPYWSSILLTTLGVRILVFPLLIQSTRNSARSLLMSAELNQLQKKKTSGSSDILQGFQSGKKMGRLYKDLNQRYGVNMVKQFFSAGIQAPIFMSLFFALRKINDFVPGYETGGTLWFTNLEASDPTYFLPIANGVLTLLNIELMSMGGPQVKLAKYVGRAFAIIAVIVGGSFSQGILLSWVSFNFITVFQTLVLRNARVRAHFDIPPLPKPPQLDFYRKPSLMEKIFGKTKSFIPFLSKKNESDKPQQNKAEIVVPLFSQRIKKKNKNDH